MAMYILCFFKGVKSGRIANKAIRLNYIVVSVG